jgi:hypothetical protein
MPQVNPYPYARDWKGSVDVAAGAVETTVLDFYWTQLPGVITGLAYSLGDPTKWQLCQFTTYINGQKAGDYGYVADQISPPADSTPTLSFVPSGARIEIKGSNQDVAPVKFFTRVRIEEQVRASSAPAPRG